MGSSQQSKRGKVKHVRETFNHKLFFQTHKIWWTRCVECWVWRRNVTFSSRKSHKTFLTFVPLDSVDHRPMRRVLKHSTTSIGTSGEAKCGGGKQIAHLKSKFEIFPCFRRFHAEFSHIKGNIAMSPCSSFRTFLFTLSKEEENGNFCSAYKAGRNIQMSKFFIVCHHTEMIETASSVQISRSSRLLMRDYCNSSCEMSNFHLHCTKYEMKSAMKMFLYFFTILASRSLCWLRNTSLNSTVHLSLIMEEIFDSEIHLKSPQALHSIEKRVQRESDSLSSLHRSSEEWAEPESIKFYAEGINPIHWTRARRLSPRSLGETLVY